MANSWLLVLQPSKEVAGFPCYYHPLRSALGIGRHRKADVAWLFADSTRRKPYAFQQAHLVIKMNFRPFRFMSTLQI
ncbi:MAG: hypothetical protein IPF93_14600 [Saprospiraceae bacterium]|nr:hypothetical protein [Saprospiraceae bacterium]